MAAPFSSIEMATTTPAEDISVNSQSQNNTTRATAAPGVDALVQSMPAQTRSNEALPTPEATPATPPGPSQTPTIAIVPGYRPGILARTVEMHLDYYYPTNGWGLEFEAALSTDLGDLLKRLDKPITQVWSAVSSTPARDPLAPPVERIVGVVYVDGEVHQEEGVARLRYFIVDESTRGLGVGKKLFVAAMEFIKESGFRECRLSTLRTLTVARKLYESVGFEEVGESWFDTFGTRTLELHYVWRRPDDAEQRQG